ncbi:hypothetical protein OUZ56_026972 [Daphnia magna]|uniref:Uncharacterized protein n=1 Tax=Daphnia magna TaxID=35525 RepID=A0ABQ9ZND1_9CRUS|nr:hypothetical protein OUZ56_026972 [Daphnia magna]
MHSSRFPQCLSKGLHLLSRFSVTIHGSAASKVYGFSNRTVRCKELCDIYNIPVEFVMRILDLHNLMVLTALSGG